MKVLCTMCSGIFGLLRLWKMKSNRDAKFVVVLQERMKRMGPAEREKYQAKKDKLERERRARRMGKTMFK